MMILVCPECGNIDCTPGQHLDYYCKFCESEFDIAQAELEEYYFGPMPLGMKEIESETESQEEPVMTPEWQKCRVCGCTWNTPCITSEGPCYWVEKDLCSACAEREEKR